MTVGPGLRSPAQLLPVGVLLLVLVYVASTPSMLVSLVVPDNFLAHVSRLYAKPLILAALLIILFVARRRFDRGALFVMAMCGCLALVYVGVDVAHYGASGAVVFAKNALYNKVIASFLVLALVYGIAAHAAFHWGEERILRLVVFTATVFAFLGMALSEINKGGWHAIGDHGVSQNNFQVYESVSILLLVVLISRNSFSDRSAALIVLIHSAVPLLMASRGGMIVSLYVLGAYLVRQSRLVKWREIFRERLAQAVGFAILLLLFGIFAAFNILESAEVLIWLDKLLRSAGLRHNLHSNSLISSSDDVVSMYSRIGTTLLAAKAFLDAPIAGIGIWNAYSDIQVANFGIHGLLPLVIAAYGLLGIVPLAGLFLMARPFGQSDVHVLAAIAMISLLVNIFPWWAGLLLWRYRTRNFAAPLPARHGGSSAHDSLTSASRSAATH
jgi:hypothetical protein